jgi:hypothetical protein
MKPRESFICPDPHPIPPEDLLALRGVTVRLTDVAKTH